LLATTGPSDVDEGLPAARKGVERLCLATREVRPVEDMIRYVAGPDGKVVADLERKLPGRGAWLSATRDALEQAIRDKTFGRVFRGKAVATPELADVTERMLEKAALSALSLANKAGQVMTGTSRVTSALSEENVAALVHASDAAADGIRKLEGSAAAMEAAGRKRPARVDLFSGEQLDLALGRPNVVHAALLVHPASAGFLLRCMRLERWRSGRATG
jgi:predicted RNA-binding protein YlxR (DUF448 family)